MKVRAIQHKDVEVELYDDEIYRIARQAILKAFDLPENPVIYNDELCNEVLVKYDPAPYADEVTYEPVRDARPEDFQALTVLEHLRLNQP